MRIVFMGTSSFAVPTLEALVDAGHEVAMVVTQPDRPSGRGRQVHESPVKVLAALNGLPVFQPERIRDASAVEVVGSLAPLDAIVVASFGQIVPQAILDIPRLGCVNVHGSLLPKYRGAAPVQHAIMAGETRTGVTTMLMDAGLDTGDILMQKAVDITPDETAGELESRLADVGAALLLKTLGGLDAGKLASQPQDASQATAARSLKREDGRIDWRKPAQDIVNLVRAFTPKPGAFTSVCGLELKVWRSAATNGGGEPGAVVEASGDRLLVAAGEGCVELIEVQPEGRRRMSGAEFARGARLAVGGRFE